MSSPTERGPGDAGKPGTQPAAAPGAEQQQQRIVTNYYTAKRMLHALNLTVQRHEQAFGVLETDVQKRVVGGGRG